MNLGPAPKMLTVCGTERQADQQTVKPVVKRSEMAAATEGQRGQEADGSGNRPLGTTLAVLLTSCVAMGKPLNVSEPQVFTCQMEILRAPPKMVFEN